MKKFLLAVLCMAAMPFLYAEEFKCQLNDGKTVDVQFKKDTAKYAYGKPDNLELVFSIAKKNVEFYRRDADSSMIMRLPYGGVYYELGGDSKGQFLQVKHKDGKVTYKSYCAKSTPAFKYNVPVTLNGTIKIIRSTHPNPPFRGQKQPAILLNSPINVQRDPEDDMTETEKNVKLIQLASGEQDKLYEQLLHDNGKKAEVRCTDLFHGFNGHHTTKVLCTLGSVRFH